jgi:hypothetical protein
MSRARGKVETAEYAKFARRILRGYGKRIADADIEDLAELIKLQAEVDAVIADAINTGRKRWEWSWADIARAAGTTREAAWKRWGKGKGKPDEWNAREALREAEENTRQLAAGDGSALNYYVNNSV